MPARAEAQMKNSVMARSRTASAERLKLRIRRLFLLLLLGHVDGLSFVKEMRSERHYLFSGLDSAGQDDLLLTDRGNCDGAKFHFRLVVHDPDARPSAAIMDCPDR